MLQISEQWESGAGTFGRNNSDSYSARVWGDPDPSTDNADDPYTILAFALPRFSPVSAMGNTFEDMNRVRNAPGAWIVTANYKSPQANRQTNDASFSFTTGGGRTHITHSRQTVGVYVPTGADFTDFKGCLNVNADGTAEGLDIDIGTFDFKTTFYVDPAKMTTSYLQLIKSRRTVVCSDVVIFNIDGTNQTFMPGELRMVDADGSKRKGYGDWEFTINWSSIPNITTADNVMIGGIGPIAKNGWDYLWVHSHMAGSSNGKLFIPTPDQVNIEQIYKYLPLSQLILPTAFGQSNTQIWRTPQLTSGGGVS